MARKKTIKKHLTYYQNFRCSVQGWYSPDRSIEEMFNMVLKIYPEVDTDIDLTDAIALTLPPLEGVGIIVLFNHQSTLSELHHETVHATSFLFHNISTAHIDETDEVYAHTSTMLFENLYNFLLHEAKVNRKVFFNMDI